MMRVPSRDGHERLVRWFVSVWPIANRLRYSTRHPSTGTHSEAALEGHRAGKAGALPLSGHPPEGAGCRTPLGPMAESARTTKPVVHAHL